MNCCDCKKTTKWSKYTHVHGCTVKVRYEGVTGDKFDVFVIVDGILATRVRFTTRKSGLGTQSTRLELDQP